MEVPGNALSWSIIPDFGGFEEFDARGKNLWHTARDAGKAGIRDLRERLRYAAMVSSFAPGVGTSVAAALDAVNALAAGRNLQTAALTRARRQVLYRMHSRQLPHEIGT
jgi:hypothetical protein